jgi:hypothetical protein
MKRLLAALAVASTLAAPLLAGPVAGREDVTGLVGPQAPLEMWFPNVFDLDHPKLVKFEGFAWSLNPTGQARPLELAFDYLDVTGQQVFISINSFSGPAGTIIPISESYEIPFCPERVSIHFTTQDAIGYQVVGQFTHQCIPEPAQIGLLAGLGMMGLGAYRRFRQRSKAA